MPLRVTRSEGTLMGFLDDAKKLGDKAKDLVVEHEDQVEKGLDKVADVVDDKTKGKHSDKIDDAVDKAKDAIDKLK
jgi:hypothetical protein